MKILFSHYLVYERHPAVVWVEEVAQALRARGHEVRVHRSFGTPLEPPSGGAGGGIAARRGTLGRLRNRLVFARTVADNRRMERLDTAAIHDFQPDIVLARQDAYCVSMPCAAGRMGVPLVTIADAPVAYETRLYAQRDKRWHPPGLVEAMERATLRRSRAVITVSHPSAERLRMYGVNVAIHVVSNGLDPTRFPVFEPEERQRRRLALGLTAPRVAGFVGTFKAFHGIDRLGELIRGTAHRDDTQWLLIGDGPERPALQESLRDCPRAIFLGSRRAEEIGPLLALLDIAVAPHADMKGEFYFCPMKILEYEVAGCAVLAGAQGDIPLILDQGRVGVVLSDFRLEAWKQALDELLDNPERCAALGRTARRFILEHHTWAHAAESIERVLADAMAAPNPASRAAAR